MAEILENIRILLPVLLASWGLFVLFTLWRPQRLLNSVLLMGSLAVTAVFFSSLFGEYTAQAMLVMALLTALVIFLVPSMLIMNGVYMIRKESRSLPNLLSLLLGIVIGVGEIAAVVGLLSDTEVLSYGKWTAIPNFIAASVIYFSLWILVFVMYVFFIQYMPHRMKFDYVIIHGCGLLDGSRMSKLLSNRVDKAIEIYQRCRQKPLLIPSGGRGEDEELSEAETIRSYLIEHGIPEEHILIEDGSATTLENLQNSFAIIKSRDGKHRTALVTSNYHVYRCLLYASKLKFRCVGIGAKVAWYYWPSATLREFAAVFTRLPHAVWICLGYVLAVLLPAICI